MGSKMCTPQPAVLRQKFPLVFQIAMPCRDLLDLATSSRVLREADTIHNWKVISVIYQSYHTSPGASRDDLSSVMAPFHKVVLSVARLGNSVPGDRISPGNPLLAAHFCLIHPGFPMDFPGRSWRLVFVLLALEFPGVVWKHHFSSRL